MGLIRIYLVINVEFKKLLIVNAAAFIGPFGGNAMLPLFGTLESEFHTPYALLTLSITFFMIPFAIIQFFSGTISDLFNRQQVCVIGLSMYSFGAFLVGLSQTFEFLIFARALQGFGYGIQFPVLLALMGDLTVSDQRGKIMGYFGASSTAGIALGPLIAGFLASFSWQLVFYITAGSALFMVITFWILFHDFPPPSKEKRRFSDFFSQIKNTLTWNILLFCIIGFITFLSYIGINISINKQFPSNLSGILLAAAGFAGIIISPIAGISVNKLGRKETAFLGANILFISVLFFYFGSSFLHFLLLFFCLGTGAATTWVALNTITVELDPAAKGTVSSLSNGFRYLGYSFASPLFILVGLPNLYIAAAILVLITLGLLFFLRVSILNVK